MANLQVNSRSSTCGRTKHVRPGAGAVHDPVPRGATYAKLPKG